MDNDLDQALICSLAQCSDLLKSLVVEGFLVVDFGFLRSFHSILWGSLTHSSHVHIASFCWKKFTLVCCLEDRQL